jgi:NADPH:quinone reductase-like Zn-dependent oxidoreductase
MKAYVVSQAGEHIELWQQRELRDPEVGAGEVLIKVKATSLNYRDLMIAKGRYGAPTVAELIPLSDGAGEVVAVGAGVTKWAGGDRVVGSFFTHWKSGQFRAEYPNAALGGRRAACLPSMWCFPLMALFVFPAT